MAEVHIYEVIRRPVVTEKSSMLSDSGAAIRIRSGHAREQDSDSRGDRGHF